jgi:hypothetical protein
MTTIVNTDTIAMGEPASATSTAVICREPGDCGPNETCSRFGVCSSGDCHYSTVGCVKGYACTLAAGHYTCVERDPSGGAGGADSGAGGERNVGGHGDPSASAGAGG